MWSGVAGDSGESLGFGTGSFEDWKGWEVGEGLSSC